MWFWKGPCLIFFTLSKFKIPKVRWCQERLSWERCHQQQESAKSDLPHSLGPTDVPELAHVLHGHRVCWLACKRPASDQNGISKSQCSEDETCHDSVWIISVLAALTKISEWCVTIRQYNWLNPSSSPTSLISTYVTICYMWVFTYMFF